MKIARQHVRWLVTMLLITLVFFITDRLARTGSLFGNRSIIINNIKAPPLPTLKPARVGFGATLYAQNCASCHGANLEGQADWQQPDADGALLPPPHDSNGHTWHHKFAFVADVGPETGQLTTAQFIIGKEDRFNGCRMRTSTPYPVQDCVFFDPFHTTETADAHAFGDQGQTLDDFPFGGLALVKERPSSLAERLATRLAAIPLASLAATAKFDNIRFGLPRLRFPV